MHASRTDGRRDPTSIMLGRIHRRIDPNQSGGVQAHAWVFSSWSLVVRNCNCWNNAAPNIFSGTAGFLAWNPFLSGVAQDNGNAAKGIGTLLSEWQNFVSHRLTQRRRM
jgi:hypothetical protein